MYQWDILLFTDGCSVCKFGLIVFIVSFVSVGVVSVSIIRLHWFSHSYFPPNHLKVVPRYYHVISVATEVKLHCFRGRGTTAAMAVDLLFCSFPSPRKCRGSKFFFVIFLAAKALIIHRLQKFFTSAATEVTYFSAYCRGTTAAAEVI